MARNWNSISTFMGPVVAALIAAGVVYIQKNTTIIQLTTVLKDERGKVDSLLVVINDCKENSQQPVKQDPIISAPASGQPGIAFYGDYKIEPLAPLTGSRSENTINFGFNVTNIREDKTVNIYTRNAFIIGEDNITKEGESAQISNSSVAGPRSNSGAIRLIQNHPLRAFIKFKSTDEIKEVHVIRFYIGNQEIIYDRKYPIKWDE